METAVTPRLGSSLNGSPRSRTSSYYSTDEEYGSSSGSNGEDGLGEYVRRLTDDSRDKLLKKMQSLKRNHHPLMPVSERPNGSRREVRWGEGAERVLRCGEEASIRGLDKRGVSRGSCRSGKLGVPSRATLLTGNGIFCTGSCAVDVRVRVCV